MNKENIIDYVIQTPHNPNKKVLDDMLETLIEESGGADNLTYSWNDLTDKPFGLTGELVVIADGVTSEPSYDMDADTYTADIAINKDFVWEDGMVFNILYCDTKYTATVKPDGRRKRISFYDEDSWTTIYIYSDGSIEWTSYDLGAFPITITYGEQQVKTIDEIYIPDTIARVSDIPKGFSGSWNDLEDKPFYNERVYYVGKYGLFECFDQMDEPYDRFYYDQSQEFNVYELLKEGQEYIVAYEDADGRYKENTYIGTDVGGNIAIGNLSFYDESYPDTGEPFIILYLVNHEWGFIGTKEPGEVELYEFSTIKVKLLDEKYIPETIARADHTHSWDDLEDTPFSEVMGMATLLPEQVFNIPPYDSASASFPCMLVLGETYTVTVDGSTYEVECTYNDNYGGQYELLVNDDILLYQSSYSSTLMISNMTEGLMTVSVSVVGLEKTGEVLDEKYIPDTIVRQSALEAYETEIVDKVISALPTWNGGIY